MRKDDRHTDKSVFSLGRILTMLLSFYQNEYSHYVSFRIMGIIIRNAWLNQNYEGQLWQRYQALISFGGWLGLLVVFNANLDGGESHI